MDERRDALAHLGLISALALRVPPSVREERRTVSPARKLRNTKAKRKRNRSKLSRKRNRK